MLTWRASDWPTTSHQRANGAALLVASYHPPFFTPASVFWKCRNPPQFCKHPHVCLARAHEWLINTEYVWRCLPDQGRTGKHFLDHWFICCNCGLKSFAAICEFVPKLGNYLSWENVFSAVLWIKTFISLVNNKSLFPIWKDSSENYNLCFSLGFMKSFGWI